MKVLAKNLQLCRILCHLGRISAVVLLPILMGCRSSQPQAVRQTTEVLFETDWYSIRLPKGWRYSGSDATCVFTSPDRAVSITLAPVFLTSGEKADSVISEVEKHLLQNTKDRRVISFWRGQYTTAGQQVPALYVVQEHSQLSEKRRVVVINTYLQKEDWLLGITIIMRHELHSQVRQHVDKIVATLQVKAGWSSEAERISVRHLLGETSDEK